MRSSTGSACCWSAASAAAVCAFPDGESPTDAARRLGISRASVYRLAAPTPPPTPAPTKPARRRMQGRAS